jgi:hypothetical protein
MQFTEGPYYLLPDTRVIIAEVVDEGGNRDAGVTGDLIPALCRREEPDPAFRIERYPPVLLKREGNPVPHILVRVPQGSKEPRSGSFIPNLPEGDRTCPPDLVTLVTGKEREQGGDSVHITEISQYFHDPEPHTARRVVQGRKQRLYGDPPHPFKGCGCLPLEGVVAVGKEENEPIDVPICLEFPDIRVPSWKMQKGGD